MVNDIISWAAEYVGLGFGVGITVLVIFIGYLAFQSKFLAVADIAEIFSRLELLDERLKDIRDAVRRIEDRIDRL